MRRSTNNISQFFLKTSFKRDFLFSVIVYFFGVLLGYFLLKNGLGTWDTLDQLHMSRWYLHQFGLIDHAKDIEHHMKAYGLIWEGWLGFIADVLLKSDDVIRMRHALNFALLPTTFFVSYLFLKNQNVSKINILFTLTATLGIIRFSGHALVNVKDFPFACTFLICSMGSYILFKKTVASNFKLNWILASSFVSFLPYLFRPPMGLLFGLLFILFSIELKKRNKNAQFWIKTLAPFTLLPLSMTVLFWPSVWRGGLSEWLSILKLFFSFPWIGPVRVFGETYASDHLPLWYPLGWWFVALNVSAFFMVAGSFVLTLIEKNSFKKLNLKTWLLLCSLSAWLIVLISKPVLYDEERHLLFLFPVTVFALTLNLRNFKNQWKSLLIVICLIETLFDLGQWSKFSYIYQNPIFTKNTKSDFMGDYWAVCASEIIEALHSISDRNITLWTPQGLPAFWAEVNRQGLASKVKLSASKPNSPYYFAFIDRNWALKPVMERAPASVKIISRVKNVFGEDYCILGSDVASHPPHLPQ